MKILVIFGTRPEAIKMCPVVRELSRRAWAEVTVLSTGQHREMLAPVLASFGVKPDYELDLMRDGQTLESLTARLLTGIGSVLEQVKPQIALVHGDTATAFVASLACFYRHIPIGHIEAGLRTYDITSPHPEELYRRAISLMAAYHFAPTDCAAENLLSERTDRSRIFVTGNTSVDALRYTVREDFSHSLLDWASGERLVIVTAHRRESIGKPLASMLRAVRRVIEECDGVKAIYPVHKNPRVRAIAEAELLGCEGIRITEPLEVADFHNFLARCHLVLTDSGGIQEEASALGKPTLVMREHTERPEGIAFGTLMLTGTGEEAVYRSFKALLQDTEMYSRMSKRADSFGDGYASARIADILKNLSEKL